MSEAGALPGERTRSGLGLLAATLAFVGLALPLFKGECYLYDDLGWFFYPLKAFYARCLHTGDSFLWCPHLYGGFYLHGEGQAAMLHPFCLALYSLLTPEAGFVVEVFVRYPLALLGMYLLLRRLDLPRDAALFGGTAFAFAGFNLLHLHHLNAIFVVAHYPWLLLCTDWLLLGPAPRRALGWLGVVLLTGSQLLLAYPQYVLFSLLLEGAWVVLRWADGSLPGLSALRPVLALATAKLLGLALGAVQLLPTAEALALSVRGAPTLEFRMMHSLPPLNVLQLVTPWVFREGQVGEYTQADAVPHEYVLHDGAFVFLLAVLALALRPKLGRLRACVSGFGLLAVLALFLAMGQYGYLYYLQASLPVVGVFRAPGRYVVVVHFALAVLAAVGYAQLVAGQGEVRSPGFLGRWLAGVAVTALLVLGFWALGGRLKGELFASRLAPLPTLLSGLGVFVLAGLLVAWASRKAGLIACVLILLLSPLDQLAYGAFYLYKTPPRSFARYYADVPFPPDPTFGQGDIRKEGLPRVWWGLGSMDDTFLLRGLYSTGGYAGLEPAQVLPRADPEFARALAVRWWVAKGAMYEGAPRDFEWEKVRDPFPLVQLAGDARESRDADQTRIWTREGFIVVDRPVALAPGGGEARLRDYRPGHIVVATSSTGPRLLVVRESFHPGWQAACNGQPVEVVRVCGDFLGCVVEGDCEVQLSFRPASFRQGGVISLSALALSLGLSALGWWRLRRAGP